MEKLFKNKEWLIEQYRQGKEIRQIAKEIRCSTASIVLANREFGISATDYNPKYLYQNEEWLKKQFEKYGTLTEVARQTGLPRTCISRYANKYGIRTVERTRPMAYSINETFFETIDTEYKAYWLGMLMADGSVHCPNVGRLRLSLKLQVGDEEHIKRFAKDIGFTGLVKRVTRKVRDKAFTSSYVEINNISFCQHAINQGICFNKSGKETFPKMPTHLQRHFIRGFMDGDGCITGDAEIGKFVSIIFCGMSKDIMVDIQEVIEKSLDIKMTIREGTTKKSKDDKYFKSTDKPFYWCKCSRRKDCYYILQWLYNDATVFLDRKHKKAMNVIQQFEQNYKAGVKPR